MEEGPKQFLEKYSDMWGLVLPKAETEKIMSLTSERGFADCQAELMTVCNSGPLGAACFNFALRIINADLVSSTISVVVDKMLGQQRLSEEDCLLFLCPCPLYYLIPDNGPSSKCVYETCGVYLHTLPGHQEPQE